MQLLRKYSAVPATVELQVNKNQLIPLLLHKVNILPDYKDLQYDIWQVSLCQDFRDNNVVRLLFLILIGRVLLRVRDRHRLIP